MAAMQPSYETLSRIRSDLMVANYKSMKRRLMEFLNRNECTSTCGRCKHKNHSCGRSQHKDQSCRRYKIIFYPDLCLHLPKSKLIILHLACICHDKKIKCERPSNQRTICKVVAKSRHLLLSSFILFTFTNIFLL